VLAVAGMRRNLDGTDAGEISGVHRAHAAKQLRKMTRQTTH
jgi:hypothetical protein